MYWKQFPERIIIVFDGKTLLKPKRGWSVLFELSSIDTNDGEVVCWNYTRRNKHLRSPKRSSDSGKLTKVYKIVWAKVKTQRIADTLQISKERIGFLLHEDLSMRKLFLKIQVCSQWTKNNTVLMILKICFKLRQRDRTTPQSELDS